MLPRKWFQEALEKAGIADKVDLSASFCMGECKDGPAFGWMA